MGKVGMFKISRLYEFILTMSTKKKLVPLDTCFSVKPIITLVFHLFVLLIVNNHIFYSCLQQIIM